MAKPKIVETVFKAGKDAHDRGILRSECPYNEGSARHTDWVLGWDAALKASHGDDRELDAKSDTVRLDELETLDDQSEDIRVLGDLPRSG